VLSVVARTATTSIADTIIAHVNGSGTAVHDTKRSAARNCQPAQLDESGGFDRKADLEALQYAHLNSDQQARLDAALKHDA
jgi:hypothetical protein